MSAYHPLLAPSSELVCWHTSHHLRVRAVDRFATGVLDNQIICTNFIVEPIILCMDDCHSENCQYEKIAHVGALLLRKLSLLN